MTVTPEAVRAINDAYSGLRLAPERIDELPIELNQLKRAIETVAVRMAFETEPSDFRVALLEVAGGVGPETKR